ncbi:MAG: hypothetical protein AB7F88_00160 [Pyrinomonadaceae bacterium]
MGKKIRSQESVYAAAQGGLATGYVGPARLGDLSQFCVSKVTGISQDTASSLGSRIIEGFGERPDRSKSRRIQQLFEIFDRIKAEGKQAVIEVRGADNLGSSVLQNLKRIREGGVGFGRGQAGVLLLGDRQRILNLLNATPELWPWTADLDASRR